MKKLTASVLVLVLSSSLALVNAQEKKKDAIKTQEIEGVVVTALGIKREKKSLGYASQEIKAEKLTEGTTKTGNVADLLAGKAAGVLINSNGNFGGSTNIVIRGVKTMGGSSPLIVIDGSPVNNSSTNGANFDLGNALSDINQEDIESMNILKGAAASALYGERGINGVIVITTKSGRGKDDGSWGVTLSSGVQAGFIDKSTFPTYQKKYGGGYDPSFYSGTAPDGHDYANFSEDASWGPKFDPNLLVYQWDSFDPSSPNYGKATPWVAAKNGPIKFFDTPVTYANTISLEKGTKSSNFTLTYDNMLSNGLLPNSDLKKNTLSTKINYDFTPKLHATVYSTLTLQNTKGRNETGYSDNIVTGFRQWWQSNVDVYALENAYNNNGQSNISWNRKSASDGRPAYWNNPYFQRYQNYESDNRTRSFSYAQVKYDITKNIGVLAKLSYDKSDVLIENRLAAGSLPQAFGNSNKDIGSGYARQNINSNETNYDLIFNYKFDITSDINISGIVGGNVRRNAYSSIYASTEGGLNVPGIYSLENSKSPALDPYEVESITQTNSGYATVSLDYKKMLYLDGTFRVDQSSTLLKGNNVYSYPSITGALILSELVKVPFVNFWKVRANYAEVGGTANPYSLYPAYRKAGNFSNGIASEYSGIYRSQTILPNPDLKPQRSKEVEVGMEGQLFKNRVSFDVAYYKTRTYDQILQTLPVSAGSGQLASIQNAGQINNQGVEVQLGIVPIKSKDFNWNLDFNWAKNKNLVVSLVHNEKTDVSNYLLNSFQGGVSLNATEGQAWGTLRGTDYVYLNGQRVINPTTGRYLQQKDQIIGNTTPDWTGGIRNSFSYKGISLSFLIDIRQGGDVFSLDQYYGLATGIYPETADYRESGVVWEGVNPNGQINTTPTINPSEFGSEDGYANMPAKRFVYDGSYVKLREASIGYSIPKSLLVGTFINMAKISLVGRNLWIIHKNLPYADPEAMVGGGSLNSYGFSAGSLPSTRNIGIDVTFKF